MKLVESCIMLDVSSRFSEMIMNNNADDLCLLNICYIGNTSTLVLIGFLNTSNKLSHFTDEEPEAYSGE